MRDACPGVIGATSGKFSLKVVKGGDQRGERLVRASLWWPAGAPAPCRQAPRTFLGPASTGIAVMVVSAAALNSRS
jgi:hypothetical protein